MSILSACWRSIKRTLHRLKLWRGEKSTESALQNWRASQPENHMKQNPFDIEQLTRPAQVEIDPTAVAGGQAISLKLLLADLDAAFGQQVIEADTPTNEIMFAAGQKALVEWIRLRYVTQGKPAGAVRGRK